ncbi:MAG: hypothetical protein ACLQAT_20130 [Candidatus Binataceae bacterium]
MTDETRPQSEIELGQESGELECITVERLETGGAVRIRFLRPTHHGNGDRDDATSVTLSNADVRKLVDVLEREQWEFEQWQFEQWERERK